VDYSISHLEIRQKKSWADSFLPHRGKESLEGLDGPFLAHPEQTGDTYIDLVDQRQILVAFGVLDFVNADRVDLAQRAVLSPR